VTAADPPSGGGSSRPPPPTSTAFSRLEGLAAALAGRATARPRRVLWAAAGVVLLLTPGLLRLHLRVDGRSLVDAGAAAVRRDAEIRGRFGLREPIVVLAETAGRDGVFDAEVLRRLQAMTAALQALPGVGADHVMSLATERRDEVFPGTLQFRTLLDPLPATAADLARLRGDLVAVGLLTGTLISADGRAATILVGVPPGEPDRTGLCRQVEAAVGPRARPQPTGEGVGAPAAEALLGLYILQDLALLLPLALLKVALVLWIACRRPWPVVLALVKVGCCCACTLGLMGWLGVPVRLPTAVLPVLLATLGLAEEIHVFFRWQRRLSAMSATAAMAAPLAAEVAATMREVARPAIVTALAMAIGFLSLVISPLSSVRALGLFAGIGVLGSLLWTLAVTPATLVLVPPGRMRRRYPRTAEAGWTVRAVAPLLARPRAAVAVLLLLTLAAGAGLLRLQVQDSWLSGFAAGSPFRRAAERADRELLGTHLLLIEVTAAAPAGGGPQGVLRAGPLLDAAVLRRIGALEGFIRTLPGVGGVQGPTDQLAAVHYLWMARREGSRVVPATSREIERTLDRFEMARGVERRREVIDDSLSRAVITVFLKGANFRDTRRILAAIDAYVRQPGAAAGLRLDLAGDVAVSQATISAVVNVELASLGLTLAAAFLVIALLWGSPLLAALGILPSAVAVLWIFGVMGALGIPLGIATAMFCAIALGLGVDYAAHLIEEVGAERRRGAADAPDVADAPDAAGAPKVAGAAGVVRRAVAVAGPAIVADTVSMGLGFAILGFSRVPANARLGQLVAFALFASCLVTLGALAPILARAADQKSMWSRLEGTQTGPRSRL
jgi:predicted RND superfamily exporter protein